MSEELKSCPFCGGEAFYIKIMGNYEKPHEIFCSKCDGAITEGRSEKQVVTNWNTRPIEDELRKRIAELETEKECEMRVFKDGNAWCFVLPDFQDLQVSSSVWMKEGALDKIYKELRSVRNE